MWQLKAEQEEYIIRSFLYSNVGPIVSFRLFKIRLNLSETRHNK
jgi:hypothetical protein